MLTLALNLLIFSSICIELSLTKCFDIPSGLYCTNLGKGADNKTIVLPNDVKSETSDVKIVYLRNSSGELVNKTFSRFPEIKSLDVQFSSIERFTPPNSVDTLYLIYNSRLPILSPNFMRNCCKNLNFLFIMGNNGLEIEPGAFNNMTNLTHLTISKQNITNITEEFFKGLEKLAYLNLKQNEILRMDKNALRILIDLNHLILSYNNFTKLEETTFDDLKLLETIELYGINFSNFNISYLNNQKELKAFGLPTSLIQEKLELKDLIKTFPKLETIGFQYEDKENVDVIQFINKCKASGYNIKFANISDL